MSNKLDRAEARLAQIAARQHGVVSANQLTALGAAPSEARSLMAAVLACGDKAALGLHRSPSLGERGMVTQRYGIPVTSPRRTIEDLEGTVEPRLWRRAKRQAEFMKYRLNLPTDRSRSDLERDFLAFLTQHRFHGPEVNVKVGRHRVDFLWRQEKVVVETDFFTVRRNTGEQLDERPDLIAAELGEVLGRGSAPSRSSTGRPRSRAALRAR